VIPSPFVLSLAREYCKLLMAGAVEQTETRIGRDGAEETKRSREGMSAGEVARERALEAIKTRNFLPPSWFHPHASACRRPMDAP